MSKSPIDQITITLDEYCNPIEFTGITTKSNWIKHMDKLKKALNKVTK